MADLEVHVCALVGHQVALDAEHRLEPEVAERQLEVQVLRVVHAAVVARDVLVDVVEVDAERPDRIAGIELMRKPDDPVQRCVLAGAIAVSAALAVPLRDVEYRLHASVHPVEERELGARRYDRVLPVDHAVCHVPRVELQPELSGNDRRLLYLPLLRLGNLVGCRHCRAAADRGSAGHFHDVHVHYLLLLC